MTVSSIIEAAIALTPITLPPLPKADDGAASVQASSHDGLARLPDDAFRNRFLTMLHGNLIAMQPDNALAAVIGAGIEGIEE